MEHIVIDKINYLSKHGYNVSLAYFGSPNDKPFFDLASSVNKLAIENCKDTTSIGGKIRNIIHLVPELKKIIRQVKPDVIVNANATTVSWILPFLFRKIPKIVELHFSYDGLILMNKELYGKNRLKAFVNNSVRRIFYPLYTRCVLLTDIDEKKWNFNNSCVIPNFTNMSISRCSQLNKKRVICVGRLDYVKNIDLLIRSWSFVVKKHPDWCLDVWGDGSLKSNLQMLINDQKLGDRVFLKGLSSSLKDVYPDYSIFVLPSRYEGFPLVLVEAMQYGLPCVGFDISGNRAIIKDGENGIIVNDRTPQDLASALSSLIESPSILKNMSDCAKKSIEKYRKENVMNMWMILFDKLCN